MKVTKPKRSRGPVRRLDLTDMRELFRDRRVWSGIGIVTKPEGASQHWEIVQDGASSVDVLVDVVLQPSEEPVVCRLPAGVWDVPDEGDEVGVILPDGASDFMPIIVCRLSTNSVPTTQGPQPGRIVMVRDEVLVHDGNGGAVALALKSDVEAVDAKYENHLHQDSTSAPTGGPLATIIPNPAAPPPYIPGLPLTPADIVGTTVLKAK